MADLTWNKGGKRLLAGIDRLIELLYQFDENELPEKALESVTQLLNGPAFSKYFNLNTREGIRERDPAPQRSCFQ